jgi:general secretion pathway protein H
MSEAGNNGFTLLETLVVVAIFALIGTLVVPNMTSALNGLSLQEEVRILQADLRVARATAIRTGQKVDVKMANGGHRYDWIGGSRDMPPGVVLGMSGPLVVYPDGSVQAAAITLSARNRRYSIDVDPVSGGVTVTRR